MPESYLENALLKLARQLVAFDEASLMDLWERYAEGVRQFEPTRRWEETALVFGLIQSVRMKNQLFNYNLADSRRPVPAPHLGMLDLTAPDEPQARPDNSRPEHARQDHSRPDNSGQDHSRQGQPRQRDAAAPGRGSARLGKPKAGKLIPLRRGED